MVLSREREKKKSQLGGSDEEYAVRPYCGKKAGKLEGVVAETRIYASHSDTGYQLLMVVVQEPSIFLSWRRE